MLAYVFWHRPRDGTGVEAYEQAELAFHRSLARTPPVGLRGSALFRVGGIPWLTHDRDGAGATARRRAAMRTGTCSTDFTALGVLNEAAVGRGHRTSHDRVSRHFGAGAGGVYGLVEGEPQSPASPLGDATIAIWIARPPERPPGATRRALGDLLGDGMDPRHASLWRRQLVLGPAPEFCLLAREPSAGVASTRLPARLDARATLDARSRSSAA